MNKPVKKLNRKNQMVTLSSLGAWYLFDPYNDNYFNLKCPDCGATIHYGPKKCPDCGAALDERLPEMIEAKKKVAKDRRTTIIICAITAMVIVCFIVIASSG